MHPLCPTCQGRGEVEAGITGNTVEYGPATECLDWRGDKYMARASYPTQVWANPHAVDRRGEVWILDLNPLIEAWGTAICQECKGSGLSGY